MQRAIGITSPEVVQKQLPYQKLPQNPTPAHQKNTSSKSQLIESYLLLLCLRTPPPAMRASGLALASPRSAGVRSSTDCEMRLHRTSLAARRPLTMGVAAVKAIMMGAKTANLGMPPFQYKVQSSTRWNGMNQSIEREGLQPFFALILRIPMCESLKKGFFDTAHLFARDWSYKSRDSSMSLAWNVTCVK